MWRTSICAEHVRIFFATDAALRPARSDEHAQVRSCLTELQAAMEGSPGAASAAAALLAEACAEAGVVPTPLTSPPGQSRPNEQGAQEVVPGLWIAPVFPVETRSWLEAARVSHVVDATGGWRRVVSALESRWERRPPCFPELAEYLVLDAEDKPGFPLDGFFEKCNSFIEAALRTPGKVVVVHCHSGVSRSTTLVMAYLMSRHGLGLQEALRVVRDARPCVRPNEGFERQLARHEMQLRVSARQGKRARDEERVAASPAVADLAVAGPTAVGPAVGAPGTAAAPAAVEAASGGGAALGEGVTEGEEEEIRSLPTEAALARLCGHLGSVGKFGQVARLLEARLASDLAPGTAAACHEALRKAIGNGRGPRLARLRPAYASLFGAALSRLAAFEDAQGDDVAVEDTLRRLLAEKAAGRSGAGGTLREAIVGGQLFGVLETLHEMLRHQYARERACAALRLAVQLGGACFGKEQRAKLASWHSRAQNFS